MPRIVLCRSGEAVRITSSDDTAHNVHIHSQTGKELNVSVRKGDELTYEVQGSANINVGCDIHPWMRALIVVEKHPYYALTNPDAELTDIPQGKYKLHAWHSELGELTAEVEVKAHSKTKVSLEYPQ